MHGARLNDILSLLKTVPHTFSLAGKTSCPVMYKILMAYYMNFTYYWYLFPFFQIVCYLAALTLFLIPFKMHLILIDTFVCWSHCFYFCPVTCKIKHSFINFKSLNIMFSICFNFYVHSFQVLKHLQSIIMCIFSDLCWRPLSLIYAYDFVPLQVRH